MPMWRKSEGNNLPPEITTTPPTTAKAGEEYRYTPEATSVDGGPVAWEMLASPPGMKMVDGVLRWRPNLLQCGRKGVAIRAVDREGNYGVQMWTIAAAYPSGRVPSGRRG